MRSTLDWVRRSTLGRRIALAMFLALAAVQAQAFLQIWTFSKPEIRMLGTRWLAQTAQNAAHAVFSAQVPLRSSIAEQLSRDGIIEVRWHAAGQPITLDDRHDVLARRLAATLDELLQVDRKRCSQATALSGGVA